MRVAVTVAVLAAPVDTDWSPGHVITGASFVTVKLTGKSPEQTPLPA